MNVIPIVEISGFAFGGKNRRPALGELGKRNPYNFGGNSMRLPAAIAALLLVSISTVTVAQTGASRFALVTVLDPRGKPVVDVGADDFVVQEGGAAREVLSVRPADYPVVVMLDTGIDARADFGMMRKAAEQFIDRVGPRPLAIGTFGGTPAMIAGVATTKLFRS